MTRFFYNDTDFTLQANGNAWDLTRTLPDGSTAFLGAGLFAGESATQAEVQAQRLIQAACPVGVKVVGPDVSHATTISGVKLVGPDVAHPNFARWDRDSSSFPREAGSFITTSGTRHAD